MLRISQYRQKCKSRKEGTNEYEIENYHVITTIFSKKSIYLEAFSWQTSIVNVRERINDKDLSYFMYFLTKQSRNKSEHFLKTRKSKRFL
ncbi:hypothetical protein DP112_01475 [Streptococcus suis]|nr:hypothetical protein DP112_01475 [Streptococcus suis]